MDMNPGDIAMSTRDGNFVIVRRGGVVQIGATQAAQRIYLPAENTIRDFAQNYSMTTFGGEMVWETDLPESGTDKTPTRWTLRVKETAEDALNGKEHFPLVLTMGTTPDRDDKTKRPGEKNLGSKPILELDISPDGSSKFNLALDRDGNIYAKSAGKGQWDFDGDLVYNVGGNRTSTVVGKDTVKAKTISREATNHEASYTYSKETVTVSKVIDCPSVAIGNTKAGVAPAIRGGPEFLAALSTAFQVVLPAGKIPVVPSESFPALAKSMSTSVLIGQ